MAELRWIRTGRLASPGRSEMAASGQPGLRPRAAAKQLRLGWPDAGPTVQPHRRSLAYPPARCRPTADSRRPDVSYRTKFPPQSRVTGVADAENRIPIGVRALSGRRCPAGAVRQALSGRRPRPKCRYPTTPTVRADIAAVFIRESRDALGRCSGHGL